MFQPSGPNFFLSNTIAWKKHSPNTIRRQSIPRAIIHADTQSNHLRGFTIQHATIPSHFHIYLLRSVV